MPRSSQRAHQGREKFNPKRCIKDPAGLDEMKQLAQRVQYTGNPMHKRNPGDFCLNPPAEPRDDKTLCDDAGIFTKSEAQRLLREGVQRGLISEQARGEFPQNVWAVTEGGCPLEAELENRTQGTYHGYPVPGNDPFRERILERWNQQ